MKLFLPLLIVTLHNVMARMRANFHTLVTSIVGIVTMLLLSAFTVHDGDTITHISYRLAYIDAPELEQTCTIENREVSIGEDAQAYLEKKVGNSLGRCKHVATDRYGREVMDCGMNLDMVRAGMALCYDKYISNGFTKARCHYLQKRAKAEKAGLWQCEDFVTPGEYRKKTRSLAQVP